MRIQPILKSETSTFQAVYLIATIIVLASVALGFFVSLGAYNLGLLMTKNEVKMAGTVKMAAVSGPSLVAYYPFDEGTGYTTVNLVNGSVAMITYNGQQSFPNPSITPWVLPVATQNRIKGSSALKFNNYRSAVDLTSSTPKIQDFTSAVTISMWIKPEKPLADMTSIYPTLINRAGSFFIYFTKSGSLAVKVVDTGGITHDFLNSAKPVLSTTTWSHIVWTYDSLSTKNSSLYVDGKLASSATASWTIRAQTTQSPYSFTISSFADGFEGRIDEVKIYNQALSAGDVNDVYLENIGDIGRLTTCVGDGGSGKFVGDIKIVNSAGQATAIWDKWDSYTIMSDSGAGASLATGTYATLDKVSYWLCNPIRKLDGTRVCSRVWVNKDKISVSSSTLSSCKEVSGRRNQCTFGNLSFVDGIFDDPEKKLIFDSLTLGNADVVTSSRTTLVVCPTDATSTVPTGPACRCGEKEILVRAGCNGSPSCDEKSMVGCKAGDSIGGGKTCSCETTTVGSSVCPTPGSSKSMPLPGTFIPTAGCTTENTQSGDYSLQSYSNDTSCLVGPGIPVTSISFSCYIKMLSPRAVHDGETFLFSGQTKCDAPQKGVMNIPISNIFYPNSAGRSYGCTRLDYHRWNSKGSDGKEVEEIALIKLEDGREVAIMADSIGYPDKESCAANYRALGFKGSAEEVCYKVKNFINDHGTVLDNLWVRAIIQTATTEGSCGYSVEGLPPPPCGKTADLACNPCFALDFPNATSGQITTQNFGSLGSVGGQGGLIAKMAEMLNSLVGSDCKLPAGSPLAGCTISSSLRSGVGTSAHYTGQAIDFCCGDGGTNTFGKTTCTNKDKLDLLIAAAQSAGLSTVRECTTQERGSSTDPLHCPIPNGTLGCSGGLVHVSNKNNPPTNQKDCITK